MQAAYAARRVADVDVFYREAGPPGAPADRCQVIAPDLPGFGHIAAPDRASS